MLSQEHLTQFYLKTTELNIKYKFEIYFYPRFEVRIEVSKPRHEASTTSL